MKNLVPYSENCIDIYEQALDRKRNDQLKQRLTVIRQDIEVAYNSYNDAFDINQLQALNAGHQFVPHKSDLHSLYGYTSYTIRELKKSIDQLQPYYLSNVCQNCTINSVNSMDHVLGQALFPEFCVHPKNLFPSCTECNGYKNASFAKNQNRIFLNLYCDQLPNVQYLFLDVFVNEYGLLDFSFVVENRNNIEPSLFNLINSHFNELYLFKRMKVHSIKMYDELRTTVSSRLLDLNWDAVTRQVKREANDNKSNLGINHFQYVLHSEMIDNQLFRESFNAV